MPRMEWTNEMDDFIREVCPGRSRSEVADLFEERFGIRLTRYQVKNRRYALGVKAGVNKGWFKKGQVPYNKGKHVPPTTEEKRRNMARTQFKKGSIPHNAVNVPLGSERVTVDGYVEVKVREHIVYDEEGNWKASCWRGKHILAWERAHGRELPPKHAVVFIDGDKANCDPSNLVLVPRSELGLMNRMHLTWSTAEELQVCRDIAKVTMAKAEAQKRPRPCKACGRTYKPEYPHQARCRECIDAGRRAPRRGSE